MSTSGCSISNSLDSKTLNRVQKDLDYFSSDWSDKKKNKTKTCKKKKRSSSSSWCSDSSSSSWCSDSSSSSSSSSESECKRPRKPYPPPHPKCSSSVSAKGYVESVRTKENKYPLIFRDGIIQYSNKCGITGTTPMLIGNYQEENLYFTPDQFTVNTDLYVSGLLTGNNATFNQLTATNASFSQISVTSIIEDSVSVETDYTLADGIDIIYVTPTNNDINIDLSSNILDNRKIVIKDLSNITGGTSFVTYINAASIEHWDDGTLLVSSDPYVLNTDGGAVTLRYTSGTWVVENEVKGNTKNLENTDSDTTVVTPTVTANSKRLLWQRLYR